MPENQSPLLLRSRTQLNSTPPPIELQFRCFICLAFSWNTHISSFTPSSLTLTQMERPTKIEMRTQELLEQDDTNEEQHRNRLCKQLLDVIRNSILTFKPSKSLSCLNDISHTKSFDSVTWAAEIDIVISGGGLKGYFMTGCSHVLKDQLSKQNVHIARVAGASAGAWVGLFMLTDLTTENWLETYYLCKDRPEMTMHEAYHDIWPWLSSKLPENAWEICSGRLFISITEITLFGFKNHVISNFTSNRDLFEACLASSTVPYISLSTAWREYRGMWVVDGGITNNIPVFTDNKRRQIVFRLSDVFYPFRLLINPHGMIICLYLISLHNIQ